MRTDLKIKGMHCGSCRALIEDVCLEITGVKSCSVDVAAGTAAIEHDESVDVTRLAREIEGVGNYQVVV